MSEETFLNAESDTPQLQIGDIEAAIKIIDYASEQGAFRGWNVIQEVLMLRNRLVEFLQAVIPPTPEVKETETMDDDSDNVPESPAAE